MMPELVNMTSSSNLFQVVMFSQSSLVSKFHFNMIIGFALITIFVFKGLTRNPKIGNSPVWILPYNWGQRRARDSKFDTNLSNEKLLNDTKYHELLLFLNY